jgi:hypothetical protein
VLPLGNEHPSESNEIRWRVDGVEGVSMGDDLTLLRDLEHGVELSVASGRLRRGIGYQSARQDTRQSLARTGAILRLRQRNRFYVHASGVADPSGRAFVFVGESGSGKSTIAFALARRGWTLLGDDGVVLEPLEDCTIVHGWRAPLLVSASLHRFFPELHGSAGRAMAGDARGRVPCEAEATTRAPLAALVFVKQGPVGSLGACSDYEALMLLVRQSPWVLLGDRHTPQHFSALQRIVSGTRVLSFCHGPDELMRIGDLFEGKDSCLAGATV